MDFPQRIGPFDIEAELGQGGLATVYRARDSRTDRVVALKILPHTFLQGPAFQARFEREAAAIKGLIHEAIVPVYDFGEEDELFYLSMRLLTGGSLPGRVARGPLSTDETLRILERVAPGLDYAHEQGVVHRNLRAGSILFDDADNAHLSDFGIVTLPEVAGDLQLGTTMEALAYMSPEQIRSDDVIDNRADLYSLGVILFEMLTGQRPYAANNPQALGKQHLAKPVPGVRETLLGFTLGSPEMRVSSTRPLPGAVDEVAAQALAKDPAARFESAGAMLATLRDALGVSASTVAPSPEVEASPDASPPDDELSGGETAEAETPLPPDVEERSGRNWLLNALIGLLAVQALLLGVLVLANFGLLDGVFNLLRGDTGADALPLTQQYSADALGFRVGLPGGWLAEDGSGFGLLSGSTRVTVAAEDAEALSALLVAMNEGGFDLTGPVFVGMVRSLEGLPEEGIRPRPLLALFKVEGPVTDLETGPTRNTRVGGEPAAYADFTGLDPASGSRVVGRLVTVVWAGHAGVCIGAAPDAEWEAFEPTFDAMMDSTELFNPTFVVGAGLAPSGETSALVDEQGEFTGGDGLETSAVWGIEVNSESGWELVDGDHADNWEFDGGRGWEITVTVRSQDESYDPIVTLIGPDGVVVGSDDDSGGGQFGQDAQLQATLDQTGQYVARVSAWDEDGGPYSIEVTSP